MTRLRHLLTLAVCAVLWALTASAQQEPQWEIKALSPDGWVELDRDGIAIATNGVRIIYGNAVLTAERVRAEMQQLVQASGCNYVICSFAWGALSAEQSLRSLRHFAREVMPAFGPA